MKLWRKERAHLVIIEGLGSYPLGTLTAVRFGDSISLYDNVRGRKLWDTLPYLQIKSVEGSFDTPQAAYEYVAEQIDDTDLLTLESLAAQIQANAPVWVEKEW